MEAFEYVQTDGDLSLAGSVPVVKNKRFIIFFWYFSILMFTIFLCLSVYYEKKSFLFFSLLGIFLNPYFLGLMVVEKYRTKLSSSHKARIEKDGRVLRQIVEGRETKEIKLKDISSKYQYGEFTVLTGDNISISMPKSIAYKLNIPC